MTEQTRERLRLNLLRQLHAVHPFGLTAAHLMEGATLDMFVVAEHEIAFELRAMAELALVELVDATVASGLVKWRRTAQGKACLVQAGLVA